MQPSDDRPGDPAPPQEPSGAERRLETDAEATVDRCVVVGIGASAGGLGAFKLFLESVPAEPGLAFVLVQHLDPKHDSRMAEILAKHTQMPVVQAASAMRVEPDHVYVIPPNHLLELGNGGTFVLSPIRASGPRTPIDHFFRSLAEQRGTAAVGVLLTGTGRDGTLGLAEIRQRGGRTIVQDPTTADHDGMPRSALAAGIVDLELPIEEIPAALLDRRSPDRGAVAALGPRPEATPDNVEQGLHAVIELLRTRTGYDFRSYKKATLERRTRRRMALHRLESVEHYLQRLRNDPDEVDALYSDLLINVTGFFRDPEAWAELRRHAIDPLVDGRAADSPVRVWIPGCSTGEEAYAMAIELHEAFRERNALPRIQLFATDLDPEAVRTARDGVYPSTIAADVFPERLERYFTEQLDGSYRVKKSLRESMVFAVQNLIGDAPFSNLDLISCRNLMIYLEAEVQQRMLQMFHFALTRNGYLFLGSSETTGRSSRIFAPISKEWRIYRKQGETSYGRRPFSATPPAAASVQRPPDLSVAPTLGYIERAKRALLDRYAPPTVLINRRHEVQFFHGELQDYLAIPRGEPTTDLLAMCADGLRGRLREVIRTAVAHRGAHTAIVPRIRRSGDGRTRVEITVEQLPSRSDGEPLLLVSFRTLTTEDGAATARPRPAADPATSLDAREGPEQAPPADEQSHLEQLEYELQSTREDLQGTIEELESSNEELKASNEEVMSMNEELQSTNEELETSREELQSLNEELSTVNSQLEGKIEEVERTNDDLSNLLSSTEIATIFLDTEFRIRRFTPATMDLLRVIPTDVGRPIRDLVPRFNDPDLYDDARTVLRKLAPIEKRVCIRDEDAAGAGSAPSPQTRWFIRRVLPFRTREDRIDGIVVTFTDVTSLTAAHASLEQRQRQTSMVARLGRMALTESSLDALFEEATRMLSDALGTEYSKVLELVSPEEGLRLRAGCGWQDAAYGALVPATGDSQASYTLRSAAPVVVDDLAAEVRFQGPQLLVDHGVVSGMSILIGPRSAPWGVLGTHSTRRIAFGYDEVNMIEAVANVLYEAVRRDRQSSELQERERQLRLVTDAMPVLIAYCDRDLIYRFCNARYYEWFSLRSDQVVGHHLRDVVGDEAFAAVAPHARRALAGERVRFRQKLPYRFGPARHICAEYIPHLDADGQVLGYYAMIEDESDRVELDETRARLAAIVANSHDAILSKDLNGIVTSWNRAAEQMYGYSAEEMVGRPLLAILPNDRRNEVQEVIEWLRQGKSVEHYETTRRARDGREIQVDLTASPIRDSNGQLTGVSVLARDVTERKERERALRESEAKLTMAKLSADIGIHDYDVVHDEVHWDARVYEIWGIDPDEKITYETFIESLHPDDRAATHEAVERALAPDGDGIYRAEYRIRQRSTGQQRWVRATGIVLFEDERPVRLVGSIQDITETQRMIEELAQADRRKDDFIATLGHELRNPLSAIVNAVECLRTVRPGEDPDALYAIVARQSGHMTSLLNDLLDIARITRGSIELRPEPLRLGDQIQRALDGIRHTIADRQQDITISVEPEDLCIVADPVRLEQVILNIVTNAAKYTPQGGRIELRGRRTDASIEIEVRDTGVGLESPEQAKRVFDLFYQVRKGSGGLGVGLSLVKSLVELHGGTVEATSPGLGKGSVVRAVFPRIDVPLRQAAAVGTAGEPSTELARLRVLAVDDHEDALMALEHLLSAHCEVRTATRGAAALAEARSFRPHVVLLDLALPDMSGFEIAAALDRDPDLPPLRKLAMTGFGDADTLQKVADAEFDSFLLKPIDLARLLDVLRGFAAGGLTRD